MRYRGGPEPIEDLVQVANIGLVNAVDRFDPEHGAPFAAFAGTTILGELRHHFRDRVWQLHLPRALQELTMKIDRAVDQLNGELSRSPTPSEIAAHLGVGSEQVLAGIAASHARRTLSLDAPADADGAPAIALIGGTEPGYDRVEAQIACGDAKLDDREWRVLRLRIVDQMTQREIGGMLGLSQMQISRINRGALWKLLAAVRGEPANMPVRPVKPPAADLSSDANRALAQR